MTLVVLPGDGIGPAVVDEALRVLDAVGLTAPRVVMPFGVGAHESEGDALPARTKAALRRHGVALLGAAGTVHGAAQPSSILRLRRELGLSRLVRPVFLDGERITLIAHASDGLYHEPDTLGPDGVVVHRRVITPAGVAELLQEARARARRRITVVDKPSVFHETRRLFERAIEGAALSSFEVEIINADAFAAGFIKRPRAYDVVVALSFVGDVLSDLMAAVAGGVGHAPSIALGAGLAVFEPVHGTAPRRAGERPLRVSPIGAIRAAALLLEQLGERERATRVHSALDVPGLPSTPDQGGVATTRELGDALVARLRSG